MTELLYIALFILASYSFMVNKGRAASLGKFNTPFTAILSWALLINPHLSSSNHIVNILVKYTKYNDKPKYQRFFC